MALIKCPDCNHEVSDAAPACPKCGRPNGAIPAVVAKPKQESEKREVSVLLGLGILFFPYLCSWLTLRGGYSTVSRILSFSWMVILLIAMGSQDGSSSSSGSANNGASPSRTSVTPKEKPKKTAEQLAAETEVCKKDLSCWAEKFNVASSVRCPKYVERLAKYDYEWTDGMLDMKFSHYRWKDQSKGVVTYIGDKIKFQNGFGAWQNYIYECDFDTLSKAVVDVRARSGRI